MNCEHTLPQAWFAFCSQILSPVASPTATATWCNATRNLWNTITTSVQHVEVAVRDLHLGMYVSELDIPWLESPFLFQGFIIDSREQLDQLNQVCSVRQGGYAPQ